MKSIDKLKRSIRYLKKILGHLPVPKITSTEIQKFIEARKKGDQIFKEDDGVSNATINRELSALKRMSTLVLSKHRQL